MSKEYTIEVPLDTDDLERMLHDGKSFVWNYPTEEDEDIIIVV